MDGNYKNIKSYSAADIQQYLAGQLSARAMHDLENAALNDPFLADAIEGMQQQDPAVFDTGMMELTKRLKDKTADENKKRLLLHIPLRIWWKVAAIIIVLFGASALTFTYLFNSRASKNNIASAKQQTIRQDSISSKKEKTGLSGQANTDTSSLTKKRSSTTQPRDITAGTQSFQPIDKRIKSNPVKNQHIAAQQELPANKEANSDAAFAKADAIPLNVDSISPSGSVVFAIPAPVQNTGDEGSFFEGAVIDDYKNPVIGATVTVKNRKTVTITDKHGIFRVPGKSGDSTVNVIVTSAGFKPASVILNHMDTSHITIQLRPGANALSEEVVTGMGIQRKKDSSGHETSIADSKVTKEKEAMVTAVPVAGWAQYRSYLAKNKKINTADSTLKGKEILSFLLDQKGKPFAFKIRKSISPSHDAEAIRLVKEGPAWKLPGGKKTRVRITIEF